MVVMPTARREQEGKRHNGHTASSQTKVATEPSRNFVIAWLKTIHSGSIHGASNVCSIESLFILKL